MEGGQGWAGWWAGELSRDELKEARVEDRQLWQGGTHRVGLFGSSGLEQRLGNRGDKHLGQNRP